MIRVLKLHFERNVVQISSQDCLFPEGSKRRAGRAIVPKITPEEYLEHPRGDEFWPKRPPEEVLRSLPRNARQPLWEVFWGTPEEFLGFTHKTEASSSKKSATAIPKEGDDALSYDQVLKILDDANKLLGAASKIPHTADGLQRMDCALRTHLSQIAIRISVEVAKYDSVFDEYMHIRSIMEKKGIAQRDHSISE
ncbi:hypothetical protein B0H13DRAFT_1865168 [Mycena leptocephala]|nr:hypothetical protein B0H13DRAFT_1865168 [Mycena leptocephala]